jgi:hypothetical protein
MTIRSRHCLSHSLLAYSRNLSVQAASADTRTIGADLVEPGYQMQCSVGSVKQTYRSQSRAAYIGVVKYPEAVVAYPSKDCKLGFLLNFFF